MALVSTQQNAVYRDSQNIFKPYAYTPKLNWNKHNHVDGVWLFELKT